MPLDLQLFGEGVYTPREAARLAGVQARDIRRWTRGSERSEPLWRAYYRHLDDCTELSFRDMLEARVVAVLRRTGVSLQAIRFAIRLAGERFGIERPLSSRRFRTDGREILMEAMDGTGELTSLSRKHPGQKVFKDIVAQSLVDLEFENDDPIRWRPDKRKHIVIDPARAFGDPIIDAFGISTNVVWRELESGLSIRQVAHIYEVPEAEIRSAANFERSLDGQGPV